MTRWGGWRWLAVGVFVPVVGGCGTVHGPGFFEGPSPSATIAAEAPESPAVTSPVPVSNQDPARFGRQVVVHARESGVDPQLVMAILYNESYKPHDPASEQTWLRAKPDAALGVANMHQATFDQVKQGRGFAERNWLELSGDPDLAIQAEAWYLHDLAAALPAGRPASLTVDELLALGYNTGPSNMRAFAQGDTVGPQAQLYLDTLRRNWAQAGEAVNRG